MSGCTARKPNREGLARVDGTPRVLEKTRFHGLVNSTFSDVPFVAQSVQSGRWSMNSQRVMSICRTHMGFRKVRKKFNPEAGSSKQYEKPVEIRTHISGSVLGEIGASKQRLAPTFNCSAWRQYWRLALRLKVWRQALAPDATSHMPQQLSVLDKIFQFRVVLFQS